MSRPQAMAMATNLINCMVIRVWIILEWIGGNMVNGRVVTLVGSYQVIQLDDMLQILLDILINIRCLLTPRKDIVALSNNLLAKRKKENHHSSLLFFFWIVIILHLSFFSQQAEIYDRIDQATLLRQEQLLKAQSLQAASLDGSTRYFILFLGILLYMLV